MERSYSINWRLWTTLFSLLCLIGLAGAVVYWFGISKKTITVTGESIVQAEPDQFTFTAYYEKEADTSSKAMSDVAALANPIVAKLKELGVPANKVTTSVSNYSNTPYPYASTSPAPSPSTGSNVASYSINAVVTDKTVAKKVYEYLATTPVSSGSITPMADFSNQTRLTLQSQAREKALIDAKAKADQTAKALGMHLGRVQSVNETSVTPTYYPMMGGTSLDIAKGSTTVTPDFEISDQEFPFSVNVVYQIF